MIARERLNQLKDKFDSAILRADLPSDRQLFVWVQAEAVKEL